MIIPLQIHQSSIFCWPTGGWDGIFLDLPAIQHATKLTTPSSSSSSTHLSLVAMDTPSHLWEWEMGARKESERAREGKVREEGRLCRDDESAAKERWRHRVRKKSVKKKKKKREQQANMKKKYSAMFSILWQQIPTGFVSFIIQCQNIYLPITDKDRIEGKFALGVIFRYVLICRIYLQLAIALLIPREEWESNSII